MQIHSIRFKMVRKYLLTALLSITFSLAVNSQSSPFSYNNPEEYTLKGITVSGIKFLDPNVITSISGLYVGDVISIPGETVTNAINKLLDQGLFSDVKITASKIEGNDIYLDIFLQELPRISAIEFEGVKKSEDKDLRELIKLRIGGQATDNVLDNAKRLIKNHYKSKAYLNSSIDIQQQADTAMANGVRLKFIIDKGPKVRISDIVFKGNSEVNDRKLRRAMKNTKRRDLNIFKASKYIEKDYEEDMVTLIDYYNKNGYRDAQVVKVQRS